MSIKYHTHLAETRGTADFGWLKSYHTFSFGQYYNPDRVRFGVLRVLNDDTVAPGMGFGTHPHDNMEIISIALSGDLEHKDSMGNVQVIRQGDVQVMSAGTGITHSEYNRNKDREVKFLQIWVTPKERNVTPRYQQISIPDGQGLTQILSPNPDDAGVWIHQDAWFHKGLVQAGEKITYSVKKTGNGVYVFVLDGSVTVNGEQILNTRDGLGIEHADQITLEAQESANLLIMEVPV